MAGPLVALAEVTQRCAETTGTGRDEVGQPDDAHAVHSKVTSRFHGASVLGLRRGSEIVAGTGPNHLNRSRVRRARGLHSRCLAAPRGNEVGQQQPADVGLGRRLARLTAGEVQVGRVVHAVQVAGLAEEQVRALRPAAAATRTGRCPPSTPGRRRPARRVPRRSRSDG